MENYLEFFFATICANRLRHVKNAAVYKLVINIIYGVTSHTVPVGIILMSGCKKSPVQVTRSLQLFYKYMDMDKKSKYVVKSVRITSIPLSTVLKIYFKRSVTLIGMA